MSGCLPVLEVVNRQEVVGVHRLDEMRRALTPHPALLVVVVVDLLVDILPDLDHRRQVGRVVQVRRHLLAADDQRLELLVAEDRARAAAAGLLQAHRPALGVVPGEIQAAHVGRLGGFAGGHDRHVDEILRAIRVHVREELGGDVTVGGLFRRFFDRDHASRAVDDDDRLVPGLAADLEGVEAAELQERAEVASDVAVDGDAGHRREGDDERLARAGVLRVAGDGARADDERVVRVVPFRLRRDGVPQVVQAEPAPAGEDVDHLLGDGLLFHRHRVEVDEQRAAGVALVGQAGRKRHFQQHFMRRAKPRDIIRISRPDLGIVGNRHDRLLWGDTGQVSRPAHGAHWGRDGGLSNRFIVYQKGRSCPGCARIAGKPSAACSCADQGIG